MPAIAYVNGRYLPHGSAAVHIEDRGYQFSDGVYEYIAFYHRRLLDGEAHLRRLARSLKELQIAEPMSQKAMLAVIRELIGRSGRAHGGLYIQVTRGVARRDHAFPKQGKAALVMTVCGAKLPKATELENGARVITQPDIRWGRRDIKSVSLMANILAKQQANLAGAREAWLVDGMEVSEGAASNAYIVTAAGEIVTHPADKRILAGITREVVLRLARESGVSVAERAFNTVEMKAAAEAFLTSTSANVLPVTVIDGAPVGDGKPGPVTRKLQALYARHVAEQTGFGHG